MVDGRLAVVAADDAEFWLALRREAAELSSRLLTVHSGRDCLRAIEDTRVRLVVLDSSLRDVSGTHLVHLVRRIRPDLGVIVAFDRSDMTQEREARQAGILYYGDRRGTREIAAVLRKGMVVAAGDGSASAPAAGGAESAERAPSPGSSGAPADGSTAPKHV